ncbi:3-(3-hydroxy-phenyl)propionate hydroxylase [Bradyrhizobium macuxiense]|uniref:3-(3-hydroxy-phenyl)propionate hydroxylase n=2 Tax=Bradyrhizobium macuxiense TaxID=1755647 RepID=A0A560KX13_9BRAD|nr:3-(3-hydroxy-phenyl)propionate hydroxylase [Bradyrhizobium macuxiense]
MRVLQGLGLAERIAPYVMPYRPTEYHGLGGEIIARYDSVPPPHAQGWAPGYVFNQPKLEQIIRETLAELPGVTVRLATELLALTQHDDHVGLSVAAPHGKIETHRARYVVGCDGGPSFVRKILGGTLQSLDFDEPWLVVDVLANEEALGRLPQTMVQYCNPARPMTYVVGTGNHRRWEIMLLPGERPEQMNQTEVIWRLLERWLKPGDGELWRSATYVFHALVAHEWRKGRVLLAGDAAHMTPPFLAQGMCQGVRDAANLAWKLASVIRQGGSDVLLDTYQEERRPHVMTTTSTAKILGRVICELDPKKALERDRSMRAPPGQQLPVKYRQEFLPPLLAGALMREQGLPVGTLIPQPKVLVPGGVTLLDDLVGSQMRLVVRADVDDIPAALCGLMDRLNASVLKLTRSGVSHPVSKREFVIVEGDGLLENWFVRHQLLAVFVRPDNYVFGVARSSSEFLNLGENIERVLLRDEQANLRNFATRQ